MGVGVILTIGGLVVDGRRPDRVAAPSGNVQWVAVLALAPGPFELRRDVQEVEAVVGVYVFTDRWDCYAGLPTLDRGDDEWFLGVAGPNRATVDELVGRLGRPTLAVAEVRSTCLTPPPPPAVTGPGRDG